MIVHLQKKTQTDRTVFQTISILNVRTLKSSYLIFAPFLMTVHLCLLQSLVPANFINVYNYVNDGTFVNKKHRAKAHFLYVDTLALFLLYENTTAVFSILNVRTLKSCYLICAPFLMTVHLCLSQSLVPENFINV